MDADAFENDRFGDSYALRMFRSQAATLNNDATLPWVCSTSLSRGEAIELLSYLDPLGTVGSTAALSRFIATVDALGNEEAAFQATRLVAAMMRMISFPSIQPTISELRTLNAVARKHGVLVQDVLNHCINVVGKGTFSGTFLMLADWSDVLAMGDAMTRVIIDGAVHRQDIERWIAVAMMVDRTRDVGDRRLRLTHDSRVEQMDHFSTTALRSYTLTDPLGFIDEGIFRIASEGIPLEVAESIYPNRAETDEQ